MLELGIERPQGFFAPCSISHFFLQFDVCRILGAHDAAQRDGILTHLHVQPVVFRVGTPQGFMYKVDFKTGLSWL
jgi:hypothetical protein